MHNKKISAEVANITKKCLVKAGKN